MTEGTMKHDSGCPFRRVGLEHSDAARRCSDAVNLHLVASGREATGSWVAIRLSDGGSDGVLYDSKLAAVNHQLHEKQCAYIRIPPPGMNPCQAESFLATQRKLYDAGFRFADPDARHGGPSFIPRMTVEEHRAQMSALKVRK